MLFNQFCFIFNYLGSLNRIQYCLCLQADNLKKKLVPLIDANSTHKTFSTKSKQNPVLAVSADAPITLDAETAVTALSVPSVR